ncbi:MAG: hypothetical protein ACE5KR_02500 [Candidatus Bipolaricaulia bacterium]
MKRAILLSLLLLFIGGLALGYAGGDSDDDGLTDAQEAVLGTDPGNPDSDGDGLSDGEEYFAYLTDPLNPDTDGDGLKDGEDKFPQLLTYRDISGVTTSTTSIFQGDAGQEIHQEVVVEVGNVITIDWTNYLHEDFTLRAVEMVMHYDYIDPTKQDWTGEGYYKIDEEAGTAEIVLPTYGGIFKATIPWPGNAMTISDWPYHLYSKPLEPGQQWEFNIFYHEMLAQNEEPFFTTACEVLDMEGLPLDLKLGRREYEVYVVECTMEHPTFNDPFFRAFLGENPQLTTRVYLTVDHGVILRYTTPYFRTTPSKSVGFSDFIVEH